MNNACLSHLLITLGFVSAFGKAPPMPEPQFEQVQLPADGSNIAGMYKAAFITVNPNTNGWINPTSMIVRDKDQFTTYVRVPKAAPSVWHRQDIYMGGRCPNEKDDVNKDGMVDYQEASTVLGTGIIPTAPTAFLLIAEASSFPKSEL